MKISRILPAALGLTASLLGPAAAKSYNTDG